MIIIKCCHNDKNVLLGIKTMCNKSLTGTKGFNSDIIVADIEKEKESFYFPIIIGYPVEDSNICIPVDMSKKNIFNSDKDGIDVMDMIDWAMCG